MVSEQPITDVWFGLDGSVALVSVPSFEWTIVCSGRSGTSALGRDLPIASDSICPITSQFLPNLYRLTPALIAPRVKLSGVKPRWLSYPSRFMTLPSVTDSPVSAAFTSPSLCLVASLV